MTWIARRLILVVLAVVALTQGYRWVYAETPVGREISDIVITGNSQHKSEEILSQLATRKGKQYSIKTIQDDVSRLHGRGWFRPDGIQVDTVVKSDGTVVVYLRVQELSSYIDEIEYRGADHMGRDEIDKLTGLKRGMAMSPSSNEAARQSILRHYHEKSRYWASVKILEGNRENDQRVVFDIVEGPVVRINSLKFQFLGAHQSGLSEGRLKTQLSSGTAYFGVLGGSFNIVQLEMDVLKLEEYYQTLGYLKARVQKELIFSKDLREVDVVFHIEEGERHRIEHFEIKPNKPTRDPAQLLPWTDNREGDYYSGKVIQADKKRIQDAIGVGGVQATVVEQVTDLGDGKVGMVYRVNEREQTRVGDIKIIGNTVTKQNVILRQLGLYPGQLLSYPEIVEAERRLSRLQIFEEDQAAGTKPTVEVENPEDDAPFKNILVQVKEKPTGSFMVGAGVNSNSGLTGSIVVNEKNFDIWRVPTNWDDIWQGRAWRGAGQELRIEAVPGQIMQRYSISFQEPYFFDSLYSLGLSGYFFQRYYNEYNEQRVGGRITFGRRITSNWSANVTTRIEEVNLSNTVLGEPPDITNYQGNTTVIGVRPSVKYDTRDNYLRPSAGMVAEGGVEGVTGNYSYQLATVEMSKYVTTYERVDGSGKHVLAFRSQTSWASDNTPVFDRFWAGGFKSIRGFAFRGISPDVNGFYVGGNFMFLNSLEYQIPVMANDNLYVVGFIDSGTVERSVELRDYRVTAGFGLRIAIPQLLGPVPLALDFGFPIHQAPQDQKQLFSFWLGFFN